MINKRGNLKIFISNYTPIILLFISVLNEFDFNNLGFKYFSFNFSYILIFYYSLKKNENLGYIFVFIAGLFNDVIAGTPMGLSSMAYLFLCGAASYLRNITLRPSLFKDWIFFLFIILILNSLSIGILILAFEYEITYFEQGINITFTFLLYYIFSNLFNFLDGFVLGVDRDR